MKILIAPWGDPANWKETTYAFEDRKVKSYSSLKILQEVINPDETIIIAADTLAQEGNTYEEIKTNAKNKIDEFAKKFHINNYKVQILPGVGHFKTQKESHFYGNTQDYYYASLYNFVMLLKNMDFPKLEVHLDITHGVNYMPVLIYRALRELLSNIALFFDVKLKVYNTDPSVPFNLLEETKINIIEDTKILPNPFREKAENNKLLNTSKLKNEKNKELNIYLGKYRDSSINPYSISAFIGSVYNGFPLGIFTFFPEVDTLEEYIKRNYEVFENEIEVNSEDKFFINRKVSLNKNFKVYIFTYLISYLLKKKCIVKYAQKEVSLFQLEILESKFFKFDERLEVSIDKELTDLKNKLLCYPDFNWQSLNSILNDKVVNDINKRNFFAHAGLEYNAVEVKKENENIYLRYREKFLETIAKQCKVGLL
jgi:CRISPR-associated protein Csx1